jgi:hypothetical protein
VGHSNVRALDGKPAVFNKVPNKILERPWRKAPESGVEDT